MLGAFVIKYHCRLNFILLAAFRNKLIVPDLMSILRALVSLAGVGIISPTGAKLWEALPLAGM
jgi:hypothetical protein